MAKIDDAVLARRQKDLDNWTADYQKRLDKMVQRHAKELAPLWQDLTGRIKTKVQALYREAGTLDDPDKIKTLMRKGNLLENLAARMAEDLQRVNRKEQPYFTGSLANVYEDSYYFTAYGLEQAAKLGVTVPALSRSSMLGVLANPWLEDGATYSTRLRANTTYLAGRMKSVVKDAVAFGIGWNEAARNIEAVAGEGYFNSVRLFRTEANRAASQASSYLFMENSDVLDGKRWNATLDGKTAAKDAANDGRIYDLDYDTMENPAIPGQRIPNHPNCRCKYSPVLSALGVSNRERIAKDGDGNRTYVKAATYDEYAEQMGLPTSKDKRDYARSYLRPGESVDEIEKKVVRRQVNKQQIDIPRPLWDDIEAEKPIEAQTEARIVRMPKVEAKTLKEAEVWAAENLKTKVQGFKGCDVSHVNDILTSIAEAEATLDRALPVEAVEFGGVRAQAYAHFDPDTNVLHVKKKDGGIEAMLKAENERAIRKLGKPQHAADTKESVFWHELGHALDHEVDYSYARRLCENEAVRRAAMKVSNYAGSDMINAIGQRGTEAWAENFTAYMVGSDRAALVPGEVVRLIEESLEYVPLEAKAAGNVVEFKPAATLKEAADYAMNKIGIDHVDYKGYDLQLANTMNKTLETLTTKYPEAADFKWVSTAQERNKAYTERAVRETIGTRAEYVKKMYDDFLKGALQSSKPGTTEADFAQSLKDMWLKTANDYYDRDYAYYKKRLVPARVKGRAWAEATNEDWGEQQGVCFSNRVSNDLKTLQAEIDYSLETQWHPIGTEDPASIVTHEYGHQIDYFLKRTDPKLRAYVIHDACMNFWTTEAAKTKQTLKETLSEYAKKNDKEFFAEAFAEYIHNPNPRPVAAEVGRRLEEALEKIRKKGIK